MSKDNFDDIVRRKFDEKQFAFNEENWENAERKLNVSRRKSKAFWWAAVFLVGLVAGMAIMLPFVEEEKEVASSQSADISNEQEMKAVKQGDKKEQNGGNKKLFVKNNEREEGQLISNKEQEDIASNEERNIGEVQNNIADKSSPAKSIQGIERGTRKIEEGLQTDKNSQGVLSPSKPPAQKEKNAKQANKKKVKDKIIFSAKEQLLASTSSRKQNSTSKQEEAKDKGEEKKEVVEKTEDKKTTAQADSILSETKTDKDTAVTVLALNDSTLPLNQTSTDTIAVADSIKSKADTTAISSKNNLKEEDKPSEENAKPNIIYIDAGINYSFGWQYVIQNEAQGMTPVGGLGFKHSLNPKWALSLGLQYGSIGRLNASQKTFSDKSFDFGLSTFDTVVETKRVYYAVLPVMLHYSLNDKSSIGAGVSISYLINSASDVLIGKKDTIHGMQYRDVIKSNGYYKGAFNSWDVALSAVYRIKLYQQFNISAMIYFGLMDVKSDAFFETKKFERNSGLKLTLSYDLFKF